MKEFLLGLYIGYSEFLAKYKNTNLKFTWVPIGFAVLVITKAYIFADIFKSNYDFYLMFLASGLASWMLVASLLSDATNVYSGRGVVLEIKLGTKFLVHMTLIYRLIEYFLILLVPILISVYFGKFFEINWILFIFNIFFVVLVIFPIMELFGFIGIIFRDFSHIVGNLLKTLFFLTPVIWQSDQLSNPDLVRYNPLTHFINLLRDPFIGESTLLFSYFFLGCIFLLTLTINFITKNIRKKIYNFI
jgi:ABC-type polysaccharide/polyol phosphate export permease